MLGDCCDLDRAIGFVLRHATNSFRPSGPKPTAIAAVVAVGLVLLIECPNLVNLALDCVRSRRIEIAIHTAADAAARALVGQFLLEGLLHSLAGRGASLGVAAVLTTEPSSWGVTDLPLLDAVSLNPAAPSAALKATLESSALFSILPAPHISTLPQNRSLAHARRGGTPLLVARRANGSLVAAQVALSVTLLVVASVLLQSLLNTLDQGSGFDAERATTTQVSVAPKKYDRSRRRASVCSEILRELEAVPSVLPVGIVSTLPWEGLCNVSDVSALGEPQPPLASRPFASFRWASPGRIPALGIPVIEGSVFRDSDAIQGPGVMGKGVAQALWPGREPVVGQLTGF